MVSSNPDSKKTQVGVGIFILNEKNELLLMRRCEDSPRLQGLWIIPGGTLEFNETQQEAAIRETKEEVGVEIEILEQWPSADLFNEDKTEHWVTTTFFAKIISGEPKIQEPHKVDELEWFALEKLPAPLSWITEHNISQYYKYKK